MGLSIFDSSDDNYLHIVDHGVACLQWPRRPLCAKWLFYYVQSTELTARSPDRLSYDWTHRIVRRWRLSVNDFVCIVWASERNELDKKVETSACASGRAPNKTRWMLINRRACGKSMLITHPSSTIIITHQLIEDTESVYGPMFAYMRNM